MTLKILLGNEFGAGRGHIVALQQLAFELLRVIPSADIKLIAPPFAQPNGGDFRSATIETSPVLDLVDTSSLRHASLPERLAALYCAHDGLLKLRLSYWRNIIRQFKPDVVVAEYAPSLSMAARNAVPCLVMGTGYSLPPPEAKKCQPFRPADTAASLVSEDTLLTQLNVVLKDNGCAQLKYLPEMNAGDDYALITIPIFDPYWETRQQTYFGVLHPKGSPRPDAKTANTGLAYFSEGLQNPAIVQGLIDTSLPIRLYCGRSRDRLEPLIHGSNIKLVDKPFDLATEMPTSAFAVSEGSLGFASAAMLAGIPQSIFYRHDEQYTIGKSLRLAQIGNAAYGATVDAEKVASNLREAASSQLMRGYATALSHRYAMYRDQPTMPKAAQKIAQLLKC
jgi:rhamnosyltransferase subunit B